MDFGITAGDTDQTIYLRLRDSTTGLAKTGLAYNSAGAVASYTLPGAARAAITLATQTVTGAHSDGGFVEVDATNCKGLYRLDLPDAAIASGKYSIISIEFDGIIEESVIVPLTLRKSDVRQNAGTNITASGGRQEVNTTHAAGTAWNSGAIGANTLASDTIAAAKIATGAITNAKFAAGAIDAAAIANNAIDAATFASDVDAEVLAWIVDDATKIDASALNTLSSHDPGATIGTSTLTQTQVSGGAYALNHASFAFNAALDFTTAQKAATLARVTLTDTATTLTGHTPQTGDGYAIVSSGTHGNAALKTLIDTIDTEVGVIDGIVDDILVDTAEIGAAGAGLTNINLPNQTMDIVGNITGNLSGSVGSVTGAVGSVTGNVGGNVTGSVGSVTTGGITRATFSADTGLQTIRSNTAQAGDVNYIRLDASASATADFYNGSIVFTTGGTGAGQARYIYDYIVGANKTAYVTPNWTTAPDNTTTFAILPHGAADLVTLQGDFDAADGLFGLAMQWFNNSNIPATIAAGAIATDAIDAASLKADAITEIQSGLATAAALDTVDNFLDTEIAALTTELAKVPKSDGSATWNATALASIQTEANDAIVANNLDHLVLSAVDTDFATTVHLNSVIGHLADNGTSATFDRTTDSLEVLGAATAPSAASIADAVWDEAIAGHAGSGSTGEALAAAGGAGDPWITALPGAYSAGQAGYILGTNLNATVSSRSSHTAANVRTEMDSNSTQLAAIVADTNELQADWVNGGRLDLIVDAILADTGELQTNQGNWLTATGFSTHSAADVVTAMGTGTFLTAIPWNASWDAEVQSEVADALAVYDPPTNAEMEARTIVSANYATSTAQTTAQADLDILTGTDGVTLATSQPNYAPATASALSTLSSTTGGIASAIGSLYLLNATTIGSTGNTTTTIHIPGLTFADDELNGHLLVIYDASSGERHARWITDWVFATELATVATLPFTPADGVDIVWISSISKDADIATILADTNELQTNQGNWSTLDAAGVRAAVGLASANLDTQLADLPTVAEFEARSLVSADYFVVGDYTAPPSAATISTQVNSDLGTGSALTALATQTSVDTLAGYVDTEVAAIKAKTDNLPSDPADASVIAAAFAVTDGLIGDLPTNAELATALDAIPTAAENAAGLLDLAAGVETGLTLRQALRLLAAASAGKLSGAATTTIVIRNAVADSKDRITATVDADGNRSAITVDLT